MLRELTQSSFWQAQLATPSAELLLKVTLLLLAALALSLALRAAAAGIRHLLWATTICALLALPLMSAVAPWRVGVLPAVGPRAESAIVVERVSGQQVPGARQDSGGETTPVQQNANEAAPFITNAQRSSRVPSLPAMLAIAWAVVALGLLGRLLAGWLLVRRIARGAEELTSSGWTTPLWEAADRLDLSDVPRLLRSEQTSIPFASGVRRPVIVLPPESEQWSAERRRAVLFHELAHVRRKDLLAHTLSRLACALYWPHPMVWSAARRLRAESERACDDLVLSTGTRASEYADHLLQIVTSARHSRAPAVALPMAQRREFEGRMLAILDPLGRRRGPRAQAAAVVAGMLVFAVLLAASAPVERPLAERQLVLQGDDSEETQAVPQQESDEHVRTLTAVPGASYERSEPFEAPNAPLHANRGERILGDAPTAGSAFEDGIADWATDVAQTTTDATFEVLRGLGFPLPQGEPSQNAQDDARRARETEMLISVLRTHGDASVRRTAAWGLQRRRGDSVAAALRSALLGDVSAEVRETAAWALGSRRDGEHAEALAIAASRDADGTVRATAAWGLGNLRARQHAGVLVPALTHPDVETRMTAAWAMGQMRPATAPAELIALVHDRRGKVQEAAGWALGQIRDPAAVPDLMRALDGSPGKGARDAIVRAIVLSASRDAAALEQLASSPHADVQERAIRAIAQGGEDFWPWPWPWPRPRPRP